MLLHALSNMVVKTIFDLLWRRTPTSNNDIVVRKSSNKKANLLLYNFLNISNALPFLSLLLHEEFEIRNPDSKSLNQNYPVKVEVEVWLAEIFIK